MSTDKPARKRPTKGRREIERLKGYQILWDTDRARMERARANAVEGSIYNRRQQAANLRELVTGWPSLMTSREFADRCRYVAAQVRGKDGKTRRWGKHRFKPYDPDSVRRRLQRERLVRFDGIVWVNLLSPVA
jgi:hypothetical protein